MNDMRQNELAAELGMNYNRFNRQKNKAPDKGALFYP
jgi:hypothetical protein